MQQQMNKDMQNCIQNCIECASTCEATLSYCLSQGGSHIQPAHIKVLLDCIDICFTSARVMSRNSEQHSITCRACAEICRACAAECNAMQDAEMKRCAAVCERCASSCESMAGASGIASSPVASRGHVNL